MLIGLALKTFLQVLIWQKKMIGIDKQTKIYAVCPDCNTLYKISEILQKNVNDQSNNGFKYTHVEFLNHLRKGQRSPCGTEITKQISIVKGYIRKPKIIFPLPSLKAQLITMYQRSGFESLLKKWTNRDDTKLITDIYDGEIWKLSHHKLTHLILRIFLHQKLLIPI